MNNIKIMYKNKYFLLFLEHSQHAKRINKPKA